MSDAAAPVETPKRSASYKTQLVRLISANGTELFHSRDGQPYATVTINAHRETMHLASRAFSDYLSREYYNAKKVVVGGTDLKDAIRVMTASAKHRGAQHDVFIRLARVDDVIWLDLGRPECNAVKITPDGWSIVEDPAVKFRRSPGLLPLPLPVPGTKSLTTLLKKLINVADPLLLIAFLLGALRGRKPYPILALHGEHGTGKTGGQRTLRRVIDPNTADLRLPPREPRDIMIAALNSHVLAYDNLSKIDDWFSDALCVLSTGGGFSTRELFSDLSETLFSAERPIMLNGISDVITRPDLLDRALVVTLEPITNRKSEASLEADFATVHPEILARLLDAVAVALKYERSTRISRLPRMADFATWIVAAETDGEQILGWKAGEFLRAYRDNQHDAIESVLDGDVIVDAIKDLKFVDGLWSGQLKDLLATMPESQYKPKSPRGLRSALQRKAPGLRSLGYSMKFTRGHVKTVEIRNERSGETEDEKRLADADMPTPFDPEPVAQELDGVPF